MSLTTPQWNYPNYPDASSGLRQQATELALRNQITLQALVSAKLNQLATKRDFGPRELTDLSDAVGMRLDKIS
jgi:hypothetical protein